MNAFISIWKKDFNFRITVVFAILYFIDLGFNGRVRASIVVPYFTSMIYSMVKMFLWFLALGRFKKRQNKLQAKFEAALNIKDTEEAGRVLVLLIKNASEFFGPDVKKEEL